MTLENIVFEPFNQNDSAPVASLESATFSKEGLTETFLQTLPESGCGIVAKKGNQIIGFACYYTGFEEAQILSVVVFDTYRHCGIGTELLRQLKKEAKKNGLKSMSLEVRKSNEKAIQFYQKFGFQIVGHRKNFYSFPVEDAVLMNLLCEETQ